MTKRIHIVLVLACFAANLIVGLTPATAQDSAEKGATEQNAGAKTTGKNTKEQNPAEKDKTETNVVYHPLDFPELQGPVELRPLPKTRITLKLTDSSRVIYENICKQANISVLFDPDYTPRSISVDLNGVSVQDALKIVAFESRTWWRPVTSEAIFVAADNTGKRREFEQQVLKTFYFPNISSPTDLQDIVNSLRTILEVQRIQQLPSFQTILVRGTPGQLAAAQKMVDELKEAKQKTGGEYRLEFKIADSNDEKKAGSRTYTLLIGPHQTGRLRIGSRVPIHSNDKDIQYFDLGKNIDCHIDSETEHNISLRLTVEVSEVGSDEHGTPESAHGDPVIQQVKMETSATVELGTPTAIGSFQDPVSKHNFQIEVIAARTKSKQ